MDMTGITWAFSLRNLFDKVNEIDWMKAAATASGKSAVPGF
jgi:hypothetical protein